MKLEELKKQFIVSEDALLAKLEGIVSVLKNYSVVTESGEVHILRRGLPVRVQMQLALVSRAIAAKLDNAIPPVLSLDELQRFLDIGREQVRARVSDLVRERFAEALGGGTYRVSFHRIESFVKSLPNSEVIAIPQRTANTNIDSVSRNKDQSRGAPRSVTTRGSQLSNLINSLIESGFFNEPRDLRAVQVGLAEKGHQYPLTSLSSAMLRQVRRRTLRRVKDQKVWTYLKE